MDISKLVQCKDSKDFFGIYKHKHSIYRISLKLPEYPSMKSSEINILKDLHNFTFEYEDTDDIHEFLRKFSSTVYLCGVEGFKIKEATLQRKRHNILNELTILSSHEIYDISIASDLTAVTISDKTHYLNLSINNHLDVSVSEHSLPGKHKWFPTSTGSITGYLNEFTRFLEQLEEFYGNINTIDELCYVVDPVQPSTKINSRIFKIDRKCFAKVVMDPLLPSSLTVTFIGPTVQVEYYRNKYEQEVSNWDHDLDVHKNLLKICGKKNGGQNLEAKNPDESIRNLQNRNDTKSFSNQLPLLGLPPLNPPCFSLGSRSVNAYKNSGFFPDNFDILKQPEFVPQEGFSSIQIFSSVFCASGFSPFATVNESDKFRALRMTYRLVYFPMRNDQDEEDDLSCSICGMFRMDDSIPMVSCDNIKCDLLFHVGCLKQWWSMFADNKTFLYIELGTKCPMCKEKLSTSFELLFTDRNI